MLKPKFGCQRTSVVSKDDVVLCCNSEDELVWLVLGSQVLDVTCVSVDSISYVRFASTHRMDS